MKIPDDKILHAFICAIATFVSFAYMSLFFSFAPALAASPLLGIGLGVGKEYGDSTWSWADILADGIGIASAVVLLVLLRLLSSL